jgi:peptide/nickel transport system substrate-binding protein
VVFREAVAWAINDNVVTDRAYFGAIPPGNGPVETGVTNGQDAEWVPSSLSSLEWTYNPPAALRLLKAYGYRPVKGWLVGPSGKRLPVFKILIGLGWTDYISIAQTIGQELLAIGVHTTIEQEPYNTYYSSAQAGTYDFLICWSNGNNATPYYEYYYLLDSAQSAAPGANAIDDYERYSSPVIDSALANFASTSSLSAQQADIVSIEKTVLTEVPVIALTGRPNFFDYSTRYFTGWPSASDPYNAGEAPDSFNGGAEQVYLNVRLR